MAKLTTELVETMIGKHAGNCAAIARACGVARPSVVGFIRRRPTLAVVLRDARQSLVDHAESALHAAVLRGERWAVLFTLKTLGKDRGYVVECRAVAGKRSEPVGSIRTSRAPSPDEFSALPLDERIRLLRNG